MTDADVDGDHIATTTGIFFSEIPNLIKNGRLYLCTTNYIKFPE